MHDDNPIMNIHPKVIGLRWICMGVKSRPGEGDTSHLSRWGTQYQIPPHEKMQLVIRI